jgi:large subunit ribosomal protein L1
MAKKAELVSEAKKLKLSVNEKNTIAQLEAAIAEAKAAKEAIAKTDELIKDTEIAVEITEAEAEIEVEEVKVAKAGKRSAKAIKEAEEKEAKEERKTSGAAAKPKQIIKVRSKLERKGKKYQAAAKLIDKSKLYSTKEALDLAVKTSTAKFDATVELHVKLGVDPRHADQNIRASIVLPEGTGKTTKVAVFGEADDVTKAKAAGADIAAADEFLQQLDKGVLDFDVLIATPSVMPKLGKYARVLGPKGLMPSPKSGTVTKDVTKAVKEAKAGKVEYRVDSSGIVHLGTGKVSFGADKINSNLSAVFASLKSAKPTSIKGNYIQSVYLSTSMGPSIKIDPSEL